MEDSKEKLTLPKSPKGFGIRHLQALLLFFMATTAYGIRSSLSVAIVAMVDTNSTNEAVTVFDWDSQQRSYILSSLLWGVLITQPIIGYIITNKGIKVFLWTGFLVSGIACILTPILAEKAGWLAMVFCRVLIGMAQGSVSPSISKILSSWAPLSERARLGSLVNNGANFGTVVWLPVTSALVTSRWGWPGIFYLFGIICILWAIVFIFLGADTPETHRMTSQEEIDYISASLGKIDEGTEKRKRKFPLKEVAKSIPFWSLVTVTCGQAFCYYFLLAMLPSYMKYVLNFDIAESGFLATLPYLAMWLLGFPLSWLSDFALKKGVPISIVRKTSNSLAMWGPAIAMIVLCTMKTENVNIYIGLFVIAVGLNAGVTCGLEINAIDMTPNFCGTIISITNTASKIFGILSPVIVGQLVVDMSDEKQWQIVFYLSATVYFVSNAIFILFGTAVKQSWDDFRISESPYENCKISTITAHLGEIKVEKEYDR